MGHNPVDVTSVVQCVIILKTVLIFPFMHVSSFSQINGTVPSLFNENKPITWICPPKKPPSSNVFTKSSVARFT